MLRKLFITLTLATGYHAVKAQTPEVHTVNIGNDPAYIENQHFKQGTNIDPQGVKFDLNNHYLRRGGKPVFPVMGEIHYSRYPRAEWEQALLGMKAAGIQVIALYNFWIHHEEHEGKFRFDDNLDVRYFLQLCKKHNLQAVVRIGPWAHGEARNGGFPDWFVKKKLKSGFDRASTNGNIQPEVVMWYTELAKQFSGLYYKDGGPIIGVQVDNEVRSNGPNSWGYQYMAALKKLAVQVGMDVPFYVVTGWPGPQVPEDEVMPLWGAYADAPWTQNAAELPANNIYQFVTDRRDRNIGNDVLKYDNTERSIYRHPFATVELGPGIQDTYLRRPVLNAKDLMGLIYTRLGAGATMLGYYVFHGTQHPLGWNKDYSTQESKSGIYPYPNDYPQISYDFQAPLSEWGYIKDHYHDFKLLHQFVADYGSMLAPMFSVVPPDNPTKADDMEKLRYAVRSKGKSGFVFFNNYVRHFKMNAHPNVAFSIKAGTESLRIPEKGGINIPEGVQGLLPFNIDAGGVLIKYTTVHPSAVIGNTYFYYAQDGIAPEFSLDKRNIATLKPKNGSGHARGNYIYWNKMIPGKNCILDITTKTGKKVMLVVLTRQQARHSYVFNLKGVKTLLLTDRQVSYNEVADQLTVQSVGTGRFKIDAYPSLRKRSSALKSINNSSIFKSYEVAMPSVKMPSDAYEKVSDDKKFDTYVATNTETPAKPNYGIQYQDSLPYKTWQITLPLLPSGIYDGLVSINYQGNTAALYKNGLIVADDYYNGLPMYFSMKRHAERLQTEPLLLQISPLLEKANIYFEPGAPLNFKSNAQATLNGITITPVYRISL